MATGTTYAVKFRRKREQKTNYKKRLNLLKSHRIRFISRPSNKNIICQLIEYHEDGDKILAHANSSDLKKMGWNHSTSNTPAAYLTGLLCGVNGKKKGVTDAILDTGLNPHIKGSKIYASLKGLVDSGIESPVDESVFPSEGRLKGAAIASYLERSKNIESDFEKLKNDIINK